MDEELLKMCRGNVEAYERVAAVRAKHADNPFWNSPDDRVKALGQLKEPVLVMEFSEWHRAVEAAAGRPVWTHEFADMQRLIDEIEGSRPKANFSDVVDMIPADKRIIVALGDGETA